MVLALASWGCHFFVALPCCWGCHFFSKSGTPLCRLLSTPLRGWAHTGLTLLVQCICDVRLRCSSPFFNFQLTSQMAFTIHFSYCWEISHSEFLQEMSRNSIPLVQSSLHDSTAQLCKITLCRICPVFEPCARALSKQILCFTEEESKPRLPCLSKPCSKF